MPKIRLKRPTTTAFELSPERIGATCKTSAETEEIEIMTASEVAKLLRISVSNLRKLVDDKKIPFFRLGKRLLFPRDQLLTWIRNETYRNGLVKKNPVDDVQNQN